jgi:hypothetical protein
MQKRRRDEGEEMQERDERSGRMEVQRNGIE